jgi:tRNA G10  N-methylase Trm11
MILDATAGNRAMWMLKNPQNIIFIDIERKLERKPTMFADNTQTPFRDKTFDTIIYDPPHGWGSGHPFYKYPDYETFAKHWPNYGKYPRYYGWEKNMSKAALISSIFYAQQEFQRILKDDGLLWLKWNEVMIPLSSILPVFTNWQELLRLQLSHEVHTAGKKKTYWVCLCKKRGKAEQSTLL